MSQRFYAPDLKVDQFSYILDPFESKHLVRVLRKKEGDRIELGNGLGDLFEAIIIDANSKRCELAVQGHSRESLPPFRLHLALALLKSNDRFEWCLEKATELGVASITPLLSDHCEKNKFNQERAERTLQSAFKQSLNAFIPELHPLQSVSDYLMAHDEETVLMGHCYEEPQKKDLFFTARNYNDYHIMIGPEGDFSRNEVLLAKQQKVEFFSLGEQRLRTETAAIVAINRILCAQLSE
ncbi:MAG: RsmE family RNA methyltransferase [Flavobacteriaceae bacterium]